MLEFLVNPVELRNNLEMSELSRVHNPHLTTTDLRSYDKKKKSDANYVT